mgnify:CR=1 FL=1
MSGYSVYGRGLATRFFKIPLQIANSARSASEMAMPHFLVLRKHKSASPSIIQIRPELPSFVIEINSVSKNDT